MSQFENDITAMLQRAADAGVHKIILPNIDVETVASMLQLQANYPTQCFASLGLHPCDVKSNYEEALGKLESYFKNENIVAVGESGLDYYYEKTFETEQKAALQVQINWAKDRKIPIILHTRDSIGDDRKKQIKQLERCFSLF
jgi:TatD DNase family protein